VFVKAGAYAFFGEFLGWEACQASLSMV